MANSKATPQLGALTLVLLVRNYRSQMIALLARNGVAVNAKSSEQQIANLMANLLKVSKSYFKDLSDFLTNPAVTKVLADGIATVSQTAQYLKASGNGYMNYEGEEYDDAYFEEEPIDPALPVPSNTPKKGFWSDLNFGEILKGGMNLFGNYTKSQSDAEIARQRAIVAQAGGGKVVLDPTKGEEVDPNDKPDTGLGTTTIVVLSFVGVALLGTVIYFIARPKKS